MTQIIGISGLVGSGKTTVAEGLAQSLPASLIHVDDYKRQIVDPKALTAGLDPPELRWQYYELALGRAFRLLHDGLESVVVDEMFHVGFLRDRIERVCEERGIGVLWVEVRCGDDTARRRVELKPRTDHILNLEQMFKIRAEVAAAFDPFPRYAANHYLAHNDLVAPNDLVRYVTDWIKSTYQ